MADDDLEVTHENILLSRRGRCAFHLTPKAWGDACGAWFMQQTDPERINVEVTCPGEERCPLTLDQQSKAVEVYGRHISGESTDAAAMMEQCALESAREYQKLNGAGNAQH